MGDDIGRGRGRALRLAACAGLLAAPAALLSAGGAAAQSASDSLSGFSKGPSGYESPVNVSTRDANGNMTIVDGVMQGASGSIFSNLASMGVATSTAGAAGSGGSLGAVGTATAIGNNLSVVVNGDNNTVIVNATQTNNAAVTASTVLNGKVNLDGAQ